MFYWFIQDAKNLYPLDLHLRDPKVQQLWHHVQTVLIPELPVDFDEAFALFCERVSVCGPVWEQWSTTWSTGS
jgi:hypothetical protein